MSKKKDRYISMCRRYMCKHTDMKAWRLAGLILGEEGWDIKQHTLRTWIVDERDEWKRSREKAMEVGKKLHEEMDERLKMQPLTPSECFAPPKNEVFGGSFGGYGNHVWVNPVIDPLKDRKFSFLDFGLKTYVVTGCWHFPFHNQAMFTSYLALLQFLREEGRLSGIIQAGDISDMHSISRHAKGQITIPGLTLESEYRDTNLCLDKIDAAVGTVEKHYFFGNHEMWYAQHMKEVDNAKLGNGVIKGPKEALRLEARGYRVQTDYYTAEVVLGNRLKVIHGDFCPEHACKKHLDKMKCDNLFFHTHRMQHFSATGYHSYNAGWGGDKTAKVFGYMTARQKEDWVNGLAIVTIDDRGDHQVDLLKLTNNKLIYNGRTF